MNIKEFKKRVKDRFRLQFSNKSYGGLPWEDWYKLAGMTNRINYGCSFLGDGSCIHMRKIKERGGSSDKMCCCNGCAPNIGYFHFIQNDPRVINRIASRFQPKTGFWRENKGCILPRKYRSATCLGYRCHDSSKSDIDGNARILMAFLNSVRSRALEGRKLYNLGKSLAGIDI